MTFICCRCEKQTLHLYTVSNVTIQFTVVGMRFYGNHEFKNSDIITLEFEPCNQYDKSAIKVMVDGIHRGYVKKEENHRIGYLMKCYPSYCVSWGKNHNSVSDLNFEYGWDVCERCRDLGNRVFVRPIINRHMRYVLYVLSQLKLELLHIK